MIQLSALTKAYGTRTLLEAVNWQILQRERVGLCGPNGAGKTTLLRMLAGLEDYDSGTIIKPANLTVGYLPQDGLTHAGRTVFEEASSAFGALLGLKAEMHEIEARLGDPSIPEPDHEAMLARYSDIQDQFRMRDGYSIELKTATVLRGLGFSDDEFERRTETFSGGWQMRLALAKLLLSEPGLLLLDEPTNHLDLEARNWLETYLTASSDAVILVSHDRFFLDAVVTHIADLTLRTLTDYRGNYSDYLIEREARMERLRTAKREQDTEVARVKMFIDRFRYQATKASQVQSRIKMLDKVVPIEVPLERKRVHFTFPHCAKSGRMVIELRGVRKAYENKVVLADASLHIERGDRIALVGPNGSGKSTLMRLLSGVETPDAGHRQEGHQVVMQYFAQDEATRLDPSLNVYETLEAGSPHQMVPAIRNILGGFLFSGDDIYKRVGVLSGGERTRLAVARMLLRPSNTLLLDEPTNHLDLDSKEVLLDALEDFGGTLIFVSHDRYFVEKLATKIIDVGHGQAVVYPGAYTDFLWSKAQAERTASSPAPAAPMRKAPAAQSRSDGASKQRAAKAAAQRPDEAAGQRRQARTDQRKREQTDRSLRAQIADLETKIGEHEQAIREIEATMAAPGFYEDREAARATVARHTTLMWEVGELMQRWERLLLATTSSSADPT